MRRLALGFALVWMVSGLGTATWAEDPPVEQATEAADVDSPTRLVEQLLAADRAWSETPPDADAFAAFFAAGGRFFPPGAPLAEGREQILGVAKALFGSPGFSLTWRATAADIAESGDLGFTFGTFELKGQDPAGVPTVVVGKYVTVWRRGSDHTWRIVADIFNSD